MTVYRFDERLAFSQGRIEATNFDTVRSMIPGCIRVDKATREQERLGIDCYAWLRDGRRIPIDVKTRERGCSHFWKDEPEFQLELWSVVPTLFDERGVTGWTLREDSETEYILYTFDRSDSEYAYLRPFQLLRMALLVHRENWQRRFKRGLQTTPGRHASDLGWQSECIFVPLSVLDGAIRQVSQMASP